MEKQRARLKRQEEQIAKSDKLIADITKVLEKGRQIIDQIARRQNDDKRRL